MTGDGAAARLLEIDALSVSMGEAQIIKNLSLDLGAGEILGLVGASGSGKSLTALAVMRLLPAYVRVTGAVRLRGAVLTDMSEGELRRIRGQDIGMVFQEPMTALNPLMSIGDQVAETVRLHRAVPAAEARRLAHEALDLSGLRGEQGALDRLPYELSGGQRQRVAIAVAAVLRPALLIADEPTTALDAGTQAQVLRLLRELAHTHNMGVILVTHDLAVVAAVTDRMALMHQGEIVERGVTRELLRDLQHPYGRALLAAAQLAPKRGAPQKDAAAPVLQVDGIVREYPRRRRSLWRAAAPLRAVDGVSLSIRPGETVGLVGESGSGKSSLLRVILALERPQAGEVRPPPATERRRKVAEVLEQVGLSVSDARRLRLAYLFVSHDLHVVRSIADRIYVMRLGRIVEQGPTEEVFAMPRHAYTRELIAAAPKLM